MLKTKTMHLFHFYLFIYFLLWGYYKKIGSHRPLAYELDFSPHWRPEWATWWLVLTVNLLESRISWEMEFWAWLWDIALVLLLGREEELPTIGGTSPSLGSWTNENRERELGSRNQSALSGAVYSFFSLLLPWLHHGVLQNKPFLPSVALVRGSLRSNRKRNRDGVSMNHSNHCVSFLLASQCTQL